MAAVPVIISILITQTSVAQQHQDGTLSPEVSIQAEDYARVRRSFVTKLLKKDRSPQPSVAADSADFLPPGVRECFFPSDTLTLKAWINRPSGAEQKKYPVVIFLHGGFAFGRADWEMTTPFQQAGFIVMTPMLRGENGQAGIFSLFYQEVDDVLAAIAYIRRQPFTDLRRIFLAGHSVGGTLALLTAMTTRKIRKTASFSASPDQMLYCRYGVDRDWIPFDTTNQREFIVRSPLAFAGSIKVPVRLWYGAEERHFRLTSQQMQAVARQKGLDVQTIEVPGGHDSAVKEEIRQAIRFFRQ